MDVAFPLIAGIVPAVVSGLAAFFVADRRFKTELRQQRAGSIATLRQRYVSPLRYWATRLDARLGEVRAKMGDDADDRQLRGWFKTIKDHAADDQSKPDFRNWCYYEGIFSITTVYYTCSYIQCARELRFQLPFSELDPDYSERLDDHLDRVSAALGGFEGIWDSTQEVLGEVFSGGDGKLNNEELCRILDSRDEFRVAPFLRLLDVYIVELDAAKVDRIRAALTGLVGFLSSERTPEHPADRGRLSGADRTAAGATPLR
jgi:hypothetical protein